MNDFLLEISPYDGYKIANAREGDILMHQTNSNNAIVFSAKPKGLATLSLSSSNVTINLDSVSQNPFVVRKGGHDALLDIDGDGNVWISSNLELGGNSIHLADASLICHDNSIFLHIGENQHPIRMGSDGVVDARSFLENGVSLRSIYATVLDKAQIKSELKQCVRLDDLENYLTLDEANNLYIPRVREVDFATLSRDLKRLGTNMNKHVAEMRENHEWTLNAIKRCVTTSTSLDMFVSASRNACIDDCISSTRWTSNELQWMLPRKEAGATYAAKSTEQDVKQLIVGQEWTSNMMQFLLPANRAIDLFVSVQRECDIDDALDLAIWCSNSMSKFVTKKELPKMFIHNSRERDIDSAYVKAQFASNAVLKMEGAAQEVVADLKSWTSNTLTSFSSNVALTGERIDDLSSRIEWHSNMVQSMMSKKDAIAMFLPVSCDSEISEGLAIAQWCSNKSAEFVTCQDGESKFADLALVERMKYEFDQVQLELGDLQETVLWTSNALSGWAGPQGMPENVNLGDDVKHWIDACITDRLGTRAPTYKAAKSGQKRAGSAQERTSGALQANVNNFTTLQSYMDTDNIPVFEFKDALYNPPFITVPPTICSRSKHGVGLWAGHEKGFIAFHTGDQAGYPIEHMRITSKGYIGVGTTSPKHELEVVGTANIEQIKEDGVYLDKKYVLRDELKTSYVSKVEWEILETNLLNKTSEIVRESSRGVAESSKISMPPSATFAKTDGLIRIPSALSKIKGLNGYTNTKTAAFAEGELQKVLPESIAWGGGVDALALIACLVEAVKDLSDRLDAFEKMR